MQWRRAEQAQESFSCCILLLSSSCSNCPRGREGGLAKKESKKKLGRREKDAARQDRLRGDEPGSLVAAALPSARRRPPRLLRPEPLPGVPRRREDGHLRALHPRAEPHGVPAPLPLLRGQGLLLQPLLRTPQAQQQQAAAEPQAGRQGLAGDRRHRGGGVHGRGGGAHQDRAQALLLLPRLRPRLRRALLLLRARALGGKQVPEASDPHEDHHLPELHHPGRHRRVARAHRHGHHQLHRQVLLQEQGHLLRHPRHRRPIRALLQPAQARLRRPQEVLPAPEQPPHGQRERHREQGAALRRGPDADGGAFLRREKGGAEHQRAAGTDGAADDAALSGVRAGRAGEATIHAHHRVQAAHEPRQAQQANLPREGLPILVNCCGFIHSTRCNSTEHAGSRFRSSLSNVLLLFFSSLSLSLLVDNITHNYMHGCEYTSIHS